MIQQFRTAYAMHIWLKYLTWLGLISVATLLLRISDGFPPQAWYLLARAAPHIGSLLASRGIIALASFAGIVFLSLTWGCLWLLLLWVSIALVWPSRPKRRMRAAINWQRTSADNLLDQGFDEPQASLAYAALARTTSPLTPPPLMKMSKPHGDAVGARVAEGRGEGLYGRPPHRNAVGARAAEGRGEDLYGRPPRRESNTSDLHESRPAAGDHKGSPHTSQPPSPLRTEDVGIGWDPGIVRKHKPNEDAVLVQRGVCTAYGRLVPLSLFVVADGMGGHASGQVASHLAIHSMMQTVLPTIQNGEELTEEFLIDTLVDSTHWANQAIHQHREEHHVDLGTTITAALLVESTAYIVNVGDSRTYIYREGLRQVTRDHSLVARLVAVGAISAEEVYTHPDRNKVYRGLGEKDSVQVDWFTEPVQAGDYLLLCSDGLWEMVREHEIEKILKRCLPDVSQASAALVKAALHRGGADNVSVIVARV